ncbi:MULTISPECIES: hypothetical protein [Moorena]|uniref:Uncharacterized protein n=1 Tax=Moorena producens 3L TaxID=489825 RepID=F4Y3W1_9CYAN|nr:MULTISPECIES: hypothetical protein [Moorena]EGJ28457.1 hypothetical protein LYNGBM3L_73480 [Moorena producens 3L]NEP66372.1 hypothetical protein [Moorena sp. SIO3A5]NER85693.1 hypothetical protein [Moorena sp. SIO3A2]NET63229.1 hypothetical protein [Moorena sp. SIO1G6]
MTSVITLHWQQLVRFSVVLNPILLELIVAITHDPILDMIISQPDLIRT